MISNHDPSCRLLEIQPQGELHNPRVTRKRSDLCRGPRAHIAAWRGKQRVIEDVEDFPANLGPQTLHDGHILDQGSVENIRGGRVERIAGSSTNNAVAGVSK